MSNGKVKEASERCDLLGINVAKQQGVLESKSDDVKVCLRLVHSDACSSGKR